MVTTDTLVERLWADSLAGAIGALRTLVVMSRPAVEPECALVCARA